MAHNLFQRYQFFCEARGAVKLITGWPEVFGELIDMAKDLEKLGVQTPLKLTECFTGMTLTRRHLQLLSSDLDGSGPWEKNLSFGHFASAAVKWSVSITEILTMARDLEAFGVKIPLLPENCPEVALTKRHLELLSRDLDGRKPWAKEISAVKCAMASILWSIPIADVFQMAQDLGGFRIQIEHQGKNLAKIELTEQECKLLSYELTGKPPYLFDLPFDQCARAALTWSVSMDEILSVAKALKDKGVSVPYLSEKDNRTPVSKRHLDLLLLDYSDLGELPVAIGLGQCVKASIEWSIRISDVLEMAQDLDGFGVEVPRLPKDLPETTFTRQHVQLLSRDLDGEPPWASEVSIAQCARAAAKWSMPFTDVISLAQDLAPFMVLTPSLAVNWSVDELSILEKLYAARRIAPFSSSDFLSGIDLGLFVAESDTSVTDIASLLARMTEANCPVDEALDLARFIIAEE